MSAVHIRELAGPAEAAALGALTLAAYRSLDGPPPPPEYEAELADVATRARAGPVLVALLDGRVVGGVAYVPVGGALAEFAGPGEAQIRMLAVDPDCHGRGVGEALVRHCLDRARAEGCVAVSLFSTTRMTAAHRLYERLGFVRAPERDWEPHPGRLLWGFRCELE